MSATTARARPPLRLVGPLALAALSLSLLGCPQKSGEGQAGEPKNTPEDVYKQARLALDKGDAGIPELYPQLSNESRGWVLDQASNSADFAALKQDGSLLPERERELEDLLKRHGLARKELLDKKRLLELKDVPALLRDLVAFVAKHRPDQRIVKVKLVTDLEKLTVQGEQARGAATVERDGKQAEEAIRFLLEDGHWGLDITRK